MTRHTLPLLVALAVAHAIAPARADAQEDHAAARTIGGTTFVLPALADSAFVLTEFGFRQGINYQQIPNFPVSSLIRLHLCIRPVTRVTDDMACGPVPAGHGNPRDAHEPRRVAEANRALAR
jgi:hypothetical protein